MTRRLSVHPLPIPPAVPRIILVDSGANDGIWGALAAFGLPLLGPEGPPCTGGVPADLPALVRAAQRDLEEDPDRPGAERRRECLAALLLALAVHFPSRYRAWFGDPAAATATTATPPSGRVVKLARIAGRRLAEVL